jgi:hypothetical protein
VILNVPALIAAFVIVMTATESVALQLALIPSTLLAPNRQSGETDDISKPDGYPNDMCSPEDSAFTTLN